MTDKSQKKSARAAVSRQITPTIKPGSLVRNRFELIEELGRGGFSVVFKARDLVAAEAGLSDTLVALKIIVTDRKSDPDIVALMHREARRIRDLVHPNILRVYDMDMQGKAHFMIMEFLDGRPLSSVLRDSESRTLDLKRIDRVVTDVSAALSHAHANGIIHADLKPGNVFVERAGSIKLIDFNIAYPTARPVKTSEEDTVHILGRLGAVTPGYASPQRLEGAEPCAGDDVYSLAVLTYVMLTGKRPFGKKTSTEAVKENIVPAQPEGLSRQRWNALKRGLALNDQDRTATVDRFAQDFTRSGLLALLPK